MTCQPGPRSNYERVIRTIEILEAALSPEDYKAYMEGRVGKFQMPSVSKNRQPTSSYLRYKGCKFECRVGNSEIWKLPPGSRDPIFVFRDAIKGSGIKGKVELEELKRALGEEENDMNLKEVGKQIRENRLNQGIGQRAISEELGLSYSKVYRIERGKCPDTEAINRLADRVGVELPELDVTEDKDDVDQAEEKSVAHPSPAKPKSDTGDPSVDDVDQAEDRQGKSELVLDAVRILVAQGISSEQFFVLAQAMEILRGVEAA